MSGFTIPKPCEQQFAQMLPTEKGAFCGACATEVIDLRNADHETIIAFFKQSLAKKTCVNITSSRLDHANTINWYNSVSTRSRMKFLFMFSLVLVFSLNVSANEKPGALTKIAATEEEHDIVGGTLPSSVEFDYFEYFYPDYNPNAVPAAGPDGLITEQLAFKGTSDSAFAVFNFTLRSGSVEFDYTSDGAYTVKIMVSGTNAFHYSEQELKSGHHKFTAPLADMDHQVLELTLEINGEKQTILLWPPVNQFMPPPPPAYPAFYFDW
jgi:hypothetical protein